MAKSTDVVDEAWGNRWECVQELKSGAQGNAMLARRLHDGAPAFLKELKGQENSERRARFSREAEVLAVLNHSGIPALLETNAQHYGDKGYRLFIATEFIDGIELPIVVSSAEFTTEQALVITDQLCSILNHAHERGVSHRDIKPDNILISGILADMQVHLVDFGVAYLEDTPEGFATEVGQEIGNRFLRLPEFSSGADNKEDPRSDITLVAGVLFYMLTGINPSILQDDLGNLPHQRGKARARLLQHTLNKDRLLALFDRAFQVEMAQRFQSIEELRQTLIAGRLDASVSSAPSSTISQLRERLGLSSNRLRVQRHEVIQQTLTTVRAIVVGLSTQLDGFVSPSQSN
jgi:eukaryotic-like serine/threonine-protein kinase